MKKQTRFIIPLAMAIFIGLTSIATAGHGRQAGYSNNCLGAHSNANNTWDGCMGYHYDQAANLPPEKQEAYQKIIKNFQDKMIPLQETIWEKHMELEALAPNPNTQSSELKTLVKEIKNLRSQMRDEHQKLRNKLEKEVGLQIDQKYHRRGCNQQSMHNGSRMVRGRGLGCNDL